MKFTAFRIQNYKGINDTTISLNGNKGSIYTLVGLNESGKTTILEAINNFRHDVDGVHAIAQRSISTDPIEALVPKKRKDNFNEDICVAAKVRMEKREVLKLAAQCKTNHGFQIDSTKLPLEFWVSRRHHFKNSAHVGSRTYWALDPLIKKKKGRKFVTVRGADPEWQHLVREIGELFPRIVYFPTFLFDFPEKILISKGTSEFEGNEYFRRMIEDALASLDDPLDLNTHIVDRVREKDSETAFGSWFVSWLQSDERERVLSALAKLSRKISEEIFDRWKDVLGSDLGRKELVIEHLVEEGDSEERQVYLTFKVKDGYTEYKVSERSLGFRWFFCFLLFTRFFRGRIEATSLPNASTLLSSDAMVRAISEAGYQPLCLSRPDIGDAILPYVESGIPVILGLDIGGSVGHAVTVIGRVFAKQMNPTNRAIDYVPAFIVHDDQSGPYRWLPADGHASTTYSFGGDTIKHDSGNGIIELNISDHAVLGIALMSTRVYSTGARAEHNARSQIDDVMKGLPGARLALAKRNIPVNERLLDELQAAHSADKIVLRTYLTSYPSALDGTPCGSKGDRVCRARS